MLITRPSVCAQGTPRAASHGWASVASAILLAVPAWAQLTVVSTTPAMNASNVELTGNIAVTFDRALNPASVTPQRFWAFGRFSGAKSGALSLSNGNQTVTLNPDRRFQAGEVVTVFLADGLQAADGSFLRAAGYSWQFQTLARCAGLDFAQIDSMSNRDEFDNQTRIYGGITTDFTGDGWVDIATINEVSSDMRLLVNRADGTGLYLPYIEPPTGLLLEVSPNEPGDFNNDGIADFAVASTATDNVCIAIGNGDGTFAVSFRATGAQPHGVAVLDVEGDGDADIVTANSGGNNLSLFFNNGSGTFSAATNFEGGGNGEYGIIAADMNNDGILDLVVGHRNSQTCTVQLGDGDGTFTAMPSQSIGGGVWVVNAGDIDGDGDMDVASANSFNANGAILRGNGAGGLAAPVTYSAPGHVPSTDLGDIDGDGDLDWVLSGFGNGAWRIYENDGAGNFTLLDDVTAPANPSCAALFDTDNDGDLDMALFDEIADVVIILQNTAEGLEGDVDFDGDVDLADLSGMLTNFGIPSGAEREDGDLDGDGAVGLPDLSILLTEFGTSCS